MATGTVRSTQALHAHAMAPGSHEGGPSREDLLASALEFAARGIRVLPVHTVDDDGHCSCGRRPCKDAGKHPVTRHGLNEASTNEETIRKLWASKPWNVAAVPGPAYAVLDFDPWKTDEAKRIAELGDLPPTLTIASGAHEVQNEVIRGEHRWYAVPDGVKVPRKVGGVDVRSDGAYVIVPPSRHQSGVRYEITEGALDAISDAPSFMVDAARATPDQLPAAHDSVGLTGVRIGTRTLHAIERGYLPAPRDDELHREVAVGIARNMREAGTPRELVDAEMERLLLDPRSSLDPAAPWTARDARRIVASVFGGHAPDRADHVQRDLSRLRLRSLEEAVLIAQEDVDWIVPDLLAAGEKAVIAGPPKSLKTWLALHLMWCVACGEAVLGEEAWHTSEPQPVLVVQEEGSPQRWAQRLAMVFCDDLSAPLHYVHRAGFSLIGPRGQQSTHVDWLIEQIKTTETRLVVIDPWQRVTPGVKENDATDTGPAWDSIHRIARETDAAVVVLHHTSKGDGAPSMDSIRGSSRMAGEVDLMVVIKKHAPGTLELFLDGRDLVRDDTGGNLEVKYERDRPHLMRAGGFKITFKPETRRVRGAVIEALQAATGRLDTAAVHDAVNTILSKQVTRETVRQELRTLVKNEQVMEDASGKGSPPTGNGWNEQPTTSRVATPSCRLQVTFA